MIAVTAERPLAELLPDKLGTTKAAGDVKLVPAEGLAELVGDQAEIYREYYVAHAAVRQYGSVRVELFASAHPFGAFGLMTYYAAGGSQTIADAIGSERGWAGDALVFWKNNYFVRVTAANGSKALAGNAVGLARAVAAEIRALKPAERPVVFHSLPEAARVSTNLTYFLGPESLNTAIPGSRDLYAFNGDAEAVVAEYALKPDPPTPSARTAAPPRPIPAPMKLLIVEYHTPQFAYDAIARANQYVDSLPESGQQRIIIKREGNYIVEAVNFADRTAAQAIVDAVQYPYGVQWLHHPSIPSPDPFRGQKAAEMLLSTFSLLGVMILSVLVGGGIFGTTLFLKRRKQMQAAYSNGGDMLRLELDPFEDTILGLPPRRE